MVLALKHLAKLAAQKLASDPAARDKALKTAEKVAQQAKSIASEPDKARAAGKVFAKALRTYRQQN